MPTKWAYFTGSYKQEGIRGGNGMTILNGIESQRYICPHCMEGFWAEGEDTECPFCHKIWKTIPPCKISIPWL